jgi:hypothetical protein
MNMLDYYTKQSLITDPGEYQNFYMDLPNTIPELCEVAQGLVFHSADGHLYQHVIAEKRLAEIDTRYCKKMLAIIAAWDACLLTKPRALENRVVGICRDLSVLLCSMLRYHHIPARVRFGFTSYHFRDFNHDIVFVEYWHAKEKRWHIVDARTTAPIIKQYKMQYHFSLYDVPLGKFIPAGMAWQMCRRQKEKPEKFGAGVIKRRTGLWYIRDRLLQDCASLNKIEPLIWDCWGLMLKTAPNIPPTDKHELQLLDEIAALTQGHDIDLPKLQKFYELENDLKVPDTITSFSPVLGMHKVKLK